MKDKKGKILFIIFGLLLAVSLWLPREAKAVNVWGDWFDRTVGQKGFDDVGFGRKDLRTIAANVVNILLGLLGVIAIILIMYAGFRWMMAGGDPEKVELAKKILVSASIGLLIVLSAWAVAIYVLSRLWLATGSQGGAVTGFPCTPDGITTACGCGGERTCTGGEWGDCVGSNCGGGGGERISCDSNVLTPACEADATACGADGICDPQDCLCSPKGGYGDPCDSDTASATCQADTNLCQSLLTCDPNQCLCLGEPVIEGVSPLGGFCEGSANTFCLSDLGCATFTPATCNLNTPNGAAGNLVSITGRYFLPYDSATSKIFFFDGSDFTAEAQLAVMANPSCTESWNDSQIIVVVPAAAKSGALKVVAANGADTTDNNRGPQINNFTVNTIGRPGLCNLNPVSGRLDSLLTYSGLGLASTEAYFGLPYQNIKANNSNFSNTSGTAQVPNLRAGLTSTFAQAPGAPFSNWLKFTQESEAAQTPVIIGFEPATGPAGQYVTIRGSGFGRSRQDNQVSFGTTPADFDFPQICAENIWRDGEIIVKVPQKLADGDYKIIVEVGRFTVESDKFFKVDKNSPLSPGLCKIEPLFGQANEAISLWGEYFGGKNNFSKIRFNQDKDRRVGVKICQGGQDDGNNCVNNGDCDANLCVEEIAYWGLDNLTNARVKPDLATSRVPFDASTGPVRVGKNDPSAWSNGINFTIGQCASDNQCGGTNVCCAAGTPRAGRCQSSAAACYGNAESSVFEWEFNTGSDNNCPIDRPNSCQDGSCCRSACVLNTNTGLTTCLDNASCAGYGASQCLDSLLCPNSPGNCSNNEQLTITGTSCNCALLCPNCTYDADLNRCLSPSVCDLRTKLEFQGKKLDKYCALEGGVGRWHVRSRQTCPDGYNPKFQGSDICVDLNSSCNVCGDKLTCLDINGSGQCGLPQLTCPSNFSCVDQVCTRQGGTCECCCDKTQNKTDGSNSACCAGLTCANSCGAGGNFGSCSGCADVGTTQAEHDAACNCSGTNGKFCDVSVPGGVCRDCGQIGDPGACSIHEACCVDFKQGNSCSGVKDSKFSENGFNYCAYYSCADNCSAPANPNKDGDYNEEAKCLSECRISCDGEPLTPGCQANNKCPADKPICNDDCFCESNNLGGESVCSVNKTSCSLLCGTAYICRGASGCQGLGCNDESPDEQATCRCCCNPFNKGSNPNESDYDSCKAIGSGNLACQENMGECTGGKRGLCCGAKTDADCGDIENVGAGNDTCCHERPRVESVTPPHDSVGVCRNTLIRAKFNKPMDKNSFIGNVIVVGDYGDNLCPQEAVLLAGAPIGGHSGSWLVNLWRAIKKILNQVVVGDQEAQAADQHNFCAFNGRVSSGNVVESDQTKTFVDFTLTEALSPNIKYYVIIQGDDGLGNKTGVLDSNQVGFNGSNNSDTQTFNGITYPHAYIWSFTTGADMCYLDSVQIDPDQHLFQKPAASYDFVANPLAANGNIIAPLAIYNWTWNWRSDNSQIAAVQAQADPNGDKATVTSGAKRDAETFIYARAVIENDEISPVSTRGSYKEGKARIIVFLCANPWPAVNDPNTWPTRWQDQADNCTIYTDPDTQKQRPWQAGDPCDNFNFEFYYCRDQAGEGTKDDLPALATENPIRSRYKYQSGSRWVDVLKDFYFFRALMPEAPAGLTVELTAAPRGGAVQLSWTADPSLTYKIYYGTASGKYTGMKEVTEKPDSANLIKVVIEGLANGQDYYFAITATNNKQVESDYSPEVKIRVEDKIAPDNPKNVSAKSSKTAKDKQIIITWDKDANEVLRYVLEYGPYRNPANKISLGSVNAYTIANLNNLDKQEYFLKLKAQDAYGNLSAGVDVWCQACPDPQSECACVTQ